MPEKDGSEDKKSTKSVVNKKQKQFMNQEEQLDLSSVAESFGGQIVGEPVELDETPLLAIPAIQYGIPAAIAVGAAGYDYYQKMKGKKGIFPDMSGVVKGVYDKIRGVHRSTTRTDQEDSSGSGKPSTEQQRRYRDRRRRNLEGEGPDFSSTSSRTGDMKGGRNNKNQNKKGNNVFSRVKDIVVGKTRAGQITRTAGVSGTTATGVTTALKNKRGFRLPRPRVPDGGHVGRRTAG